jgi:glycosyl transferase family 1
MLPSTHERAQEPSFVVFSDDWGEHPSSCQHLFRHIAKTHSVLWVNTIGMRCPMLTGRDLRKILRKVSKMLWRTRRGSRQDTPLRLSVLQPPMFPYSAIPAVRNINRRCVTKVILRRMLEMNIVAPVVISTVPNACDYVDLPQRASVIYYCVDDFAQWPGLDHELVQQMEDQLIDKTDIFVATSAKLYQRLLRCGKPTHLLTHGVDMDRFSVRTPEEHTSLAGIHRPRVGYFGLFDERSDQGLLGAVASLMRDVSFVITGPIATTISTLQNHSNVHFTGPVAYSELPAIIAGLDVLYIPYVVNTFTDSISPLKLKEYLATARPIISTPIAEAKRQSQYVTIASTADEWQAAIRGLLHVDPAARRELMSRVMAHESWADKAASFLSICSHAGSPRDMAEE